MLDQEDDLTYIMGSLRLLLFFYRTQETRPTIRNKPPLRDIAVLSVTQPFALNDTVRPICIVDSFPTIRLPKDTFLIAGFGKRSE